MYGSELTHRLIRLLLSGKSYTVRQLTEAIIEAFPDSFTYSHQKQALYYRILRQLHTMKQAKLIRMTKKETDLHTKFYVVCLDLET